MVDNNYPTCTFTVPLQRFPYTRPCGGRVAAKMRPPGLAGALDKSCELFCSLHASEAEKDGWTKEEP